MIEKDGEEEDKNLNNQQPIRRIKRCRRRMRRRNRRRASIWNSSHLEPFQEKEVLPSYARERFCSGSGTGHEVFVSGG